MMKILKLSKPSFNECNKNQVKKDSQQAGQFKKVKKI